MAKEILVSENLTQSMIDSGKRLIKRLDEKGSGVESAFWFFHAEEKKWIFTVESPLVDRLGPKDFYWRVINSNIDAGEEEEVISLNDISVVGAASKIAQLIRKGIQTGTDISGIRFSRNTVNGVFIEDAYIYRSI